MSSAGEEAGGSRAAPPPPGDAGLSRGSGGLLGEAMLLLLPLVPSSSLVGAAADAVVLSLAAESVVTEIKHPRRPTLPLCLLNEHTILKQWGRTRTRTVGFQNPAEEKVEDKIPHFSAGLVPFARRFVAHEQTYLGV